MRTSVDDRRNALIKLLRDADQLARLYRAGELETIYVPQPEDEAAREQHHRARQQLKMFLLQVP